MDGFASSQVLSSICFADTSFQFQPAGSFRRATKSAHSCKCPIISFNLKRNSGFWPHSKVPVVGKALSKYSSTNYVQQTLTDKVEFNADSSNLLNSSKDLSQEPSALGLECWDQISAVSLDMSEVAGVDSNGRAYQSEVDMWQEETGEGARVEVALGGGEGGVEGMEATHGNEKKQRWYRQGVQYWESVPATVDGVLGGYGEVSRRDVAGSSQFLNDCFGENIEAARREGRRLTAVDCGAGVGRITNQFLQELFDDVDLVEPVQHFLEAARTNLVGTTAGAQLLAEEASSSSLMDSGCWEVARGSGKEAVRKKRFRFFCEPLQNFSPPAARYDVVWVQWCIGHLTDIDFVKFFQRCKEGLKAGGIIVLKENTCQQGFVLDKSDSSVTRSDEYFRRLIHAAGLHILASKLQKGFPKELFAVRMYCLSPTPPTESTQHRQTRSRKRPAANSPAVIY